MTSNIGDILAGKQKFVEPPEIRIIKAFVNEHYQSMPEVTIKESQIIIGVSNAALAGALRMQLHKLQELCQTKKRLVIRIGS